MIGLRLEWLSIPTSALEGFEPSQLAVLANTLADGALPQIEALASGREAAEKFFALGLKKAPREIGDREGYPDYVHSSGKRVELKGLFVNNPELKLKRPPTAREPSARIKDNITQQVVKPETDVLLVAALQFRDKDGECAPVVTDIGVFSMWECVLARDARLAAGGGKWVDKVPMVLKRGVKGRVKREGYVATDDDLAHDTNFGKLARTPYRPLLDFMVKHGAISDAKARKVLKGEAIPDEPDEEA